MESKTSKSKINSTAFADILANTDPSKSIWYKTISAAEEDGASQTVTIRHLASNGTTAYKVATCTLLSGDIFYDEMNVPRELLPGEKLQAKCSAPNVAYGGISLMVDYYGG